MKKYYFDTSIWLDLFEKRDEPNLPKGKFVKELIEKIVNENGRIIYSDVVKNELIELGYLRYEIEPLFFPFKRILIYTQSTRNQFNRARDIAKNRNIPTFDVLHMLLSKEQNAIMVTRDKHFSKLLDFAKVKKPEELI